MTNRTDVVYEKKQNLATMPYRIGCGLWKKTKQDNGVTNL